MSPSDYQFAFDFVSSSHAAKGQQSPGRAVHALADASGVPKWVGRLLAQIPADDFAELQKRYSFAALTRWLDAVGPNRAPRGEDLWSFAYCLSEIEGCAHLLGRCLSSLVPPGEICWEALDDSLHCTGEYDLRSFLERFFEDVVLPDAFIATRALGFDLLRPYTKGSHPLSTNELGILGASLFGNKALRSVLRLVEDSSWGSLSIVASLPGGEKAAQLLRHLPAWTQIFAPMHMEGLVATHLCGVEAVVNDGLAMRHCLGRYAWHCSLGRYLAFSIHTKDGYRLGSVLVKYDEALKVEECSRSGHANCEMDPRASQAVERLIEELNSRRSELVAFEAARRQRAIGCDADNPESEARYPFYFAPLREWKFRAYYAPMLPRSEARLSRDEWLEAKGLAGFAREWAARRCASSTV